MRKAQFRTQAERSEDSFIIYKSYSYRWESDETADPQYDDVEYHLTKEAAEQAMGNINPDTGFQAMVDSIKVYYDDFNDKFEFGEEFELEEVVRYSYDLETVIEGNFNNGGELPEDGIIVWYKHHRYMNYAYDIVSIEPVKYSSQKTFADLRNDRDSTFATYAYVADNIDELEQDFRWNQCCPFNKLNSGSRIVREFLAEQGHADYVEEIEEED